MTNIMYNVFCTLSMSDPGADGTNFAQDAFGFALGYFQGDYKPIGGNALLGNSQDWNTFQADTHNQHTGLFNGNISWMTTSIMDKPVDGYNPQLQTMVYQYDQLNRIKQGKAYGWENGSSWTSLGNTYQTNFDYDANGNIQHLSRYAGINAETGQALFIDDLSYSYNTNINGHKTNNRLRRVLDPQGFQLATQNDFGFNDSSVEDAYEYDEIGNLTKDQTSDIEHIDWTVYGKINQITKTTGEIIHFDYDGTGNRISKAVTDASGNTKTTYYVRDASGNILATYNKNDETAPQLAEHVLYGSSRLGVYNANTDTTTTQASPIRLLNVLSDDFDDYTSGEELQSAGWYSSTPNIMQLDVENGKLKFTSDNANSRIHIDFLTIPNQFYEITFDYTGSEAWIHAQRLDNLAKLGHLLKVSGAHNPHARYIFKARTSSSRLWVNHRPPGIGRIGTIDNFKVRQIQIGDKNQEIPLTVAWDTNSFQNVTLLSNGKLKKTGGTNGASDAGAFSQTKIEGDGFVEFIMPANLDGHRNVYFGLSDEDVNAHASTIDFHYRLFSQRAIRAYRLGAARGIASVNPLGYKIRIERLGNYVFYSRNGSIMNVEYDHTNGAPLYLDVSMITSDEHAGTFTMGRYEPTTTTQASRTLGNKHYELSNHLGNVLAVVSDKKQYNSTTAYTADLIQADDYYPFGMTIPDRHYSSGEEYRFGFQGQETDDEVNGQGNSIYFKYRVHDPRIGRFASVDPLAPKYPWNSPYAFSENRVVDSRELEGLERYFAADGSYLTKIGESDEVRVLDAHEVNMDLYHHYKETMGDDWVSDYLVRHSTILSKNASNVVDAVYETIFEMENIAEGGYKLIDIEVPDHWFRSLIHKNEKGDLLVGNGLNSAFSHYYEDDNSGVIIIFEEHDNYYDVASQLDHEDNHNELQSQGIEGHKGYMHFLVEKRSIDKYIKKKSIKGLDHSIQLLKGYLGHHLKYKVNPYEEAGYGKEQETYIPKYKEMKDKERHIRSYIKKLENERKNREQDE